MRLTVAKLGIVFAVAALGLAAPRLARTASAPTAGAEPVQRRTQRPSGRAPARRARRPDYARFDHATQSHQKSCDSCHKFPSANWKEVRKGEDAFEDVTEYPEHASCLSCHREQFFARERPRPTICAVCHVAASPRDLSRKPFPNPLERYLASPSGRDFESDFRVFFPHDKHADLFGMNARPVETARGPVFVSASYRAAQDAAKENASCANCHQLYKPQGKDSDEYLTKPPKDLGDRFWLKKGTFMTVPLSHASCFSCHSAESGMKPGPTDCATCHRLPPPSPAAARRDFDAGQAAQMAAGDQLALYIWRRRDSAGAYRHEGGAHPDLTCTTCHNVSAMNTADPSTTRVALDSCNTCHATATSEEGGALNVEIDQKKAKPSFQCAKCHVTFGREPVPATHAKAVAPAKTD